MTSAVPGGEFLTGALNVISQSLAIPVIILLLIIIVLSILIAGSVISEYTSRKKVPTKVIRDLIFNINSVDNIEELKNLINKADIPISQKRVLIEISNSGSLDNELRESFARKLVENEEEKIDKTLEKTDIITRVGPTLGLMGTLIPMGPGLAALGTGDINTLASAIIVAFDTTVVGIGAGALCYVISKVRRGWYDNYLSDLDALTDSVLNFMNR